MTDYGLLITGFNPMPADVVEAEVIADLRAIEGLESLSAGDEEAFAKWAAIHAEREALIWNLIYLVWQSGSRELSTGASLDNNLSLIANSRLEEDKSDVAVTLYNRNSSTPVTVPVDSQVRQSATGVIWTITEEAEIPGNALLHTALNVTNLTWQSGNTMQATFGATDFSGVAVGDEIVLTGSTNAVNDGRYPITAVSDASNYLEYRNPNVSSGATNETGSPASADVGDSITVLARSLSAGPYEAAIASIDEIVTPISGWDAAINLAVALVGRNQETDSAAKARAAEETANATGGTLEAVKQAVEAIEGVYYVFAEQNVTNAMVGDLKANSIRLVVGGGAAQDIVNAIGSTRADGTDTNGGQSGSYTDSSGNPEVIYYDEVSEANPYLSVRMTVSTALTSDEETRIKTSLADTSWTNGQDLTNWPLVTAVGNLAITKIITLEIWQSLTPGPTAPDPITIPGMEVVNVTADRVTLVYL